MFGEAFTDHMFLVEHITGKGWGIPRIMPFGPIPVHPAAQVLHYGMSCFEGMKAYCSVKGQGLLFRPELNMARLFRSSQRLSLAHFDQKELLECLKRLLQIDRSWLPDKMGYSIYCRPFVFASSTTLGVSLPSRTSIAIILSPVGPYFATGVRPITLFLDEENVRAWPGGIGQYKCGGNYAPTIKPQSDAARAHGASQVLYTLPMPGHPPDAIISESGAMNIFFFLDKPDGTGQELVTPPLDGTILPGVTRDSVVELTRGWGEFDVNERPINVSELVKAHQEGRLKAMFGCGTACIVQPIDRLVRAHGEAVVAPYVEGSTSYTLTNRIRKELVDIHYGAKPSSWSVPFE